MSSVERLVERAARGDQVAFRSLVKWARPMLFDAIAAFFLPGGDRADLMQEAIFGLWKGVRDFDPSQGWAFSTFAEFTVKRQVITAVKAATRYKHGPLNYSASTEQLLEDPDEGGWEPPSPGADPLERLLAREELEALLEALRHDLTVLERQALLAVGLDGATYEEVAQAAGVDFKSVDNALQRARMKLGRAVAGLACTVCGTAIDWGRLCAPCGEEMEFSKQFLEAA